MMRCEIESDLNAKLIGFLIILLLNDMQVER